MEEVILNHAFGVFGFLQNLMEVVLVRHLKYVFRVYVEIVLTYFFTDQPPKLLFKVHTRKNLLHILLRKIMRVIDDCEAHHLSKLLQYPFVFNNYYVALVESEVKYHHCFLRLRYSRRSLR